MRRISRWQHCCVELTYEPGHPEDASVRIQYMGSTDDFDIVARTLADAFWLLEQDGWQLAAVARRRGARRRGRDEGLLRCRVQTDSYFFKRNDGMPE